MWTRMKTHSYTSVLEEQSRSGQLEKSGYNEGTSTQGRQGRGRRLTECGLSHVG